MDRVLAEVPPENKGGEDRVGDRTRTDASSDNPSESFLGLAYNAAAIPGARLRVAEMAFFGKRRDQVFALRRFRVREQCQIEDKAPHVNLQPLVSVARTGSHFSNRIPRTRRITASAAATLLKQKKYGTHTTFHLDHRLAVPSQPATARP